MVYRPAHRMHSVIKLDSWNKQAGWSAVQSGERGNLSLLPYRLLSVSLFARTESSWKDVSISFLNQLNEWNTTETFCLNIPFQYKCLNIQLCIVWRTIMIGWRLRQSIVVEAETLLAADLCSLSSASWSSIGILSSPKNDQYDRSGPPLMYCGRKFIKNGRIVTSNDELYFFPRGQGNPAIWLVQSTVGIFLSLTAVRKYK